MRTYLPVLVRGKESEGVKMWGFGKQVYQELLTFIADPDYGDITDPTSGRDLVITYTPPEGSERYPKTTIMVKPNVTPATEDKNVAEMVMNGQTDIFDIYKKCTYDDLKAALATWLNGGEEGEAPAATAKSESPFKDTSADAPASVKKTDNISAAFDDLFS